MVLRLAVKDHLVISSPAISSPDSFPDISSLAFSNPVFFYAANQLLAAGGTAAAQRSKGARSFRGQKILKPDHPELGA